MEETYYRGSEMKIGYLMTFLAVCGGNRIIFEHATRLSERGHDVYLITQNVDHKDWFGLKKFKNIHITNPTDMPDDLDCLIGTYWTTVTAISILKLKAKKYFYLVQSDDRRFIPEQLLKEEVEKTYKSDIHFITIARWLRNMLYAEFGKESIIIENKLNKEDFYPDSIRKDNKKIVVLVEGSVDVKFKGVYDALAALEGLDVIPWLVTNSQRIPKVLNDGFYKVFVTPPQKKLRQLYSSADILVKVSWYEGSPLVQQEAMACDTALITSNATGTEEHCINEYNCLKVPIKDIESIRQAIRRLIEDKKLRDNLAHNGRKYAEKYLYDWNLEIDKLEEYLIGVMNSE